MVKIYVGNLSKTARRDELQALFQKYGKVVECDILREFGFVHMDDVHEAEQAVKALNGSMFCGNSMRVEMSTATKRDKPAPTSRDRQRSRSPRMRGDYHRDTRDFYRERDYDSYRGYAPPPPPSSGMSSSNGNSPSFYAMLAAAAASVHNQLRSSGAPHDSMEVYSRMYHAISNAAASSCVGSHSNGGPPPPPLPGLGYDRQSPPSYSGSRYGGDPYGGGGVSGGVGAGYESYDRRRF